MSSRLPTNSSETKRRCEIVNGVLVDVAHLSLIRGLAQYPTLPLVLTGETGTGKEELAKILLKTRKERGENIPFVAINCAHLNMDLAASLLFGHRKGAFSGALESTCGYIGDAHGGILFLDEIHALSSATQQKMLRVLNDGTYTRVGEVKELCSKFQLVVASTRDLDDEVVQGRMLPDLRHRIEGIEIKLLPLRERVEDTADLIRLAFARHGYDCDPCLFEALVARCIAYHWPGNIRQLLRAIDLCLIKAKIEQRDIRLSDLPQPAATPSEQGDATTLNPVSEAAVSMLQHAFTNDVPLETVMNTVEKAVIAAACARHQTFVAAQRALDIGKTTLDMKRRKYRIDGEPIQWLAN